MTDYAAWQRSNDEYLASALAALRHRLERLAATTGAPAIGWLAAEERRKPSIWERMWGQHRDQESVRRSLPAPSRPGSSQALDRGAESLPVLAGLADVGGSASALHLLARQLGLSRFEQEVLLLAVGVELDTRIGRLCARAQDDPSRPFPTFALAMALFDDPSWDVLSPERPLRYWRLLEISQPAGQPLTASALRADERIVNYVKGLNSLDDRIASLVTAMPPAPGDIALPPSHEVMCRQALEAIRGRDNAERVPLIQLAGGDAASRQLVASRVAEELGLRLYELVSEAIPLQPAELDHLARLWDREAALLPLALYLEGPDGESAGVDSLAAAIGRFTARARSLMFLSTRDPRPNGLTATAVIDVRRPSTAEQRAAWQTVLGDGAAESARRLSAQFDLSLPAIRRLASRARSEPPRDATGEGLWSACLAATRPALDRLAQRIDVRADWGDLVLPADPGALLRQIVAQVAQRSRVYQDWGFARRMNRGLGISALFAGESGTGKSMAAEVIARDLRLDLYRIDLSAVVSKYIGETEKNLRRVFDAAEEGGAILLFDEADALFGKRSEVKDSHDRYANIEINYLLQRLEAYRGLAILTTNMKSALDQAFLRRLRFVVDFPFPGLADRRRIWRQVFPSDAEVGSLDVERLARLNLTGGSIHGIALGSAFLAAHHGQPVTMTHVLEAVRTEYRKLERPISEVELRRLQPAEVVA